MFTLWLHGESSQAKVLSLPPFARGQWTTVSVSVWKETQTFICQADCFLHWSLTTSLQTSRKLEGPLCKGKEAENGPNQAQEASPSPMYSQWPAGQTATCSAQAHPLLAALAFVNSREPSPLERKLPGSFSLAANKGPLSLSCQAGGL